MGLGKKLLNSVFPQDPAISSAYAADAERRRRADAYANRLRPDSSLHRRPSQSSRQAPQHNSEMRRELFSLADLLDSKVAASDSQPDDYGLTLQMRALHRSLLAALEQYYDMLGARDNSGITAVCDTMRAVDARLESLDHEVRAEVARFETAAGRVVALAHKPSPPGVASAFYGLVVADQANELLLELSIYQAGWANALQTDTRSRLEVVQTMLRSIVDVLPTSPQMRPPSTPTFSVHVDDTSYSDYSASDDEGTYEEALDHQQLQQRQKREQQQHCQNAFNYVSGGNPPYRSAPLHVPPQPPAVPLPQPQSYAMPPPSPPSRWVLTQQHHQYSRDKSPSSYNSYRQQEGLQPNSTPRSSRSTEPLGSRPVVKGNQSYLSGFGSSSFFTETQRTNLQDSNEYDAADDGSKGYQSILVMSRSRTLNDKADSMRTASIGHVNDDSPVPLAGDERHSSAQAQSKFLENVRSSSAVPTPGHTNPKTVDPTSFAAAFYQTENVRLEAVSDSGKTFKRKAVKGDGRCLFRSVARARAAARGKPNMSERAEREEADHLRAQAVAELKKHRLLLAQFYVIDGDFSTYCRRMSHPRTFGGEPELLMMAKLLHTPIAIYIKVQGRFRNIQVYGRQYRGEQLRILYSDGIHYDCLLETYA
jgi:OTU-like cysteine protease